MDELEEEESKLNEDLVEDLEDNDEEEEDWSESPPLTEDEDESEEVAVVQSQVTEKAKSVRRSVSFGDVSERLFSQEQDNGLMPLSSVLEKPDQACSSSETKILQVEFSPPAKMLNLTLACSAGQPPRHPGDLVQLFGSGKTKTKAFKTLPKKSILKSNSKYGRLSESQEDLRLATPKMAVEAQHASITAVSDVVIERNATKPAGAQPPPVTQVFSRFRATRVNQ